MFKCDNSVCQNNDAKERVIKCNGLCNKSFHGPCAQLPRNWFSSSLADALSNHFVCENCINFNETLRRMNSNYKSQLRSLFDQLGGIVESNDEKFTLLAAEFEAYSKSYEDLKAEVTTNNLKTDEIVNELREMSTRIKENNVARPVKRDAVSGWRTVGNVRKWKADWSSDNRKSYGPRTTGGFKYTSINNGNYNNNKNQAHKHFNKRKNMKKNNTIEQSRKKNLYDRNPRDINQLDEILSEFHNQHNRENDNIVRKAVRFPNFSNINYVKNNNDLNNNKNFSNTGNTLHFNNKSDDCCNNNNKHFFNNENVFYRSNNNMSHRTNNLNQQNCCQMNRSCNNKRNFNKHSNVGHDCFF